jgi:hypothetical protein
MLRRDQARMAELSQSEREEREAREAREARAQRRRGLLALERELLRRAGGGRGAYLFRVLLFLGFAGAILLVRSADGGDAPLEGLVGAAARWSAWLVGAPLALSAARDSRAEGQRDGIAALAAARGFSAQAREGARVFAAMLEMTAALGVPLVALAGLAAAVAGSFALVVARVGLALGCAAFAVVAGVTLGGISAACGVVGRARGRWLLLAVIAGPWIVADLTGHRYLSIPGVLAAVLKVTLGGTGA